ncbi:MAG TPA: DNA adenine methylase [Sphingobacteriaceae bacterium]
MIEAIGKGIRPLIKWAGGKYDEFEYFSPFIPANIRYYIEPFMGGGGVFFARRPGGMCYLNDKSTDLIQFYTSLSDPEFKRQAFLYVDAWDQAGLLSAELLKFERDLFLGFMTEKLSLSEVEVRLATRLAGLDRQQFYPLFDAEFCPDPQVFQDVLIASLTDKFRRVRMISEKNSLTFSSQQLAVHFATGIKSGAYLYLRKLMNDDSTGRRRLPQAKRVANWYFVREFCYASMFRFNTKGEFNIPYGGAAYNRKKIRRKIERLFTAEVSQLFRRSQFFNLDFEQFLNRLSLSDEDFIFLDPPYDSKFSIYDQNAFTKADQKRLARWLLGTSARWMLIIKETPFIRSLYTAPGIVIHKFDKSYTYNVRGRNNRQVKHLAILNYGQD